MQLLAHHAPVHRSLRGHELRVRRAAQATAGGDAVGDGLRHVVELDAAALDQGANRRRGCVFVRFGVEGGDEREDVPFKGVEPSLEHVDGGAPDGVGALGEAASDGGGAQGDGDGRDGHLGGEGEKGDATHILRRVARSLDDVGDGEVGDGEGAEDGLTHVLVLLGAEQGDERGGDDVVAEVTVLAAVLESAQRPRSLRANHGNLIPQAVEHHLLHALVEVVGDLSLDAEGVQDTRDELAHAEPDGPVLGGGEVEEEPEEVLAKLVGLVLGAGGSRRGEMDEESDHALGAEVPLWMIGGGLNERQACAGIMGWLIRRDTRVIARWAARSAWGT